jgi:hypothetical protein
MTERNIDTIRGEALDRVDRSERHYRLAFFGAVVVEAAFLVTFLLLADFTNRTQVLLLLATCAVYTLLALGLVAVGVHINRNTTRVLTAIQLAAGGQERRPHL